MEKAERRREIMMRSINSLHGVSIHSYCRGRKYHSESGVKTKGNIIPNGLILPQFLFDGKNHLAYVLSFI